MQDTIRPTLTRIIQEVVGCAGLRLDAVRLPWAFNHIPFASLASAEVDAERKGCIVKLEPSPMTAR